MRLVCEECKKIYDYEKDDFCPRCGAYNQPGKRWGVDAQGHPVRVDGVNEVNHKGSFAHREVHQEKAKRRALGLDHPKRAPRQSQRPPAQRVQGPSSKERQKKGQTAGIIAVVVWIIIILQILRVFLE